MGGKQSRSFSSKELNEVSVSQSRKSSGKDDQPSVSSAAERIRRHTTVHFGYSTLSLAMRALAEPPSELWELRELQKLNLSMNSLCSLPPALGALDNLVILNLWGNNLSSLPPEISLLKKLRVLFACRNRLSEVPEELGSCTCLEVLSLANNQTIADQIQDLVNLKILIVEGNSIHTLPKTLCFLESLELLNVDFNDLHNLTKLNLSHNRIAHIPTCVYRMKGLVFLHLACNRLDKGLHIIHNPLLKPIQEVLQGGLSALYNYLKPT